MWTTVIFCVTLLYEHNWLCNAQIDPLLAAKRETFHDTVQEALQYVENVKPGACDGGTSNTLNVLFNNTEWKPQANAAVRLSNLLTKNWLMTNGTGGYMNDEFLFAMTRTTIEIEELAFGSAVAFEPFFYRNMSKFCAYSFHTGNGSIKSHDISVEYDYFPSEWYLGTKSKFLNLTRIPDRQVTLRLSEYNGAGVKVHMNTSTFIEPIATYEDGFWTRPYFDCGGGDIWMITFNSPILAYINGSLTFAGVATCDVALNILDIDQCDAKENATTALNVFRGTHHCKPATTECTPRTGLGFRRGTYLCTCLQGYYFPNKSDPLGAFAGLDVETAFSKWITNGSHEYFSNFDCRPCPKGCPTCRDATPCYTALPITEITAGAALGVLLLAGAFGFLMYRRAKEEATLSSMDWLAQWTELTYNDGSRQKSRLSVMTVNSQKPDNDNTKHDRATLFSTNTSGAQIHQVLFRGNLVVLRMCEKRKIDLTKDLRNEIKIVRIVTHENLLRFVGAILGPDQTAVLMEFCSKGNLQNLLNNDAFKLDDLFKTSLINDIVKGMLYIHGSPLHVHGRLNSRCCYIDSRFVLKIGDYGLPTFYDNLPPSIPDNEYFTTLLWKAPEVLNNVTGCTPEADVYSFGIIVQETVLREEPFGMHVLSAEEIVRMVTKNNEPPFRPMVKADVAPAALLAMMERCWVQNPASRPRFQEIRSIMRQISRNDDQQGNIMDTLMKRMEEYAENLEGLVEEKTQAFLEEKRKSDQLLNQILPKTVAEQLKKGQPVHPETYETVTIYFSDIVGFTTMSSESTPMQIVDFLNDLYTCFDATIMQFDVYKVETIGDSYMCASGLPIRNGSEHAGQIAGMALRLLGHVTTFRIRHRPADKLLLRIGAHSGPCVAGVVGLTMPRYCLFGDTVNTASRMESTGEALKIQVSSATKTLLDTLGGFECEERGEIPVKGKGHIRTFWLLQERDRYLSAKPVQNGHVSVQSLDKDGFLPAYSP